MSDSMKIIYTNTDEAPALATLSLLPIIQAFTGVANVSIETADISLAARILCGFNDQFGQDKQTEDYLQILGELAKTPEANIVKLPNISASVPQLKAAIEELQSHGFALPDHPDDPSGEQEKTQEAVTTK